MTGALRLPFLGLWVTVLWVGFWGELTLANVLGGVAVAVVVLAVTKRSVSGISESGTVRPIPALHLAGYFLVELVRSNLRLAKEIVTWRDDSAINTAIIAVPLPGASPGVATLVANAVTLTPGTLTVEVLDTDDGLDELTLYVHVLHHDDADSARSSVTRLHELAERAFGTVGAPAVPAGDATSTDGGGG